MLRQITHPSPVLADTTPAQQLARALAVPARLISRVGPRQWDLPTPCSRWSVRSVIGHLVDSHQMVTIGVRRPSAPAPDPLVPRQSTGPDRTLAHTYREAAEALVDALADPGALDRPVILRPGPAGPAMTAPTDPSGRMVSGLVALHLQVVEALVHGWDLASATGQTVLWPDDLAEQSLAFMIGRLTAYREARAGYAPPKAAGAYAPAIDRLVACLGRDVER